MEPSRGREFFESITVSKLQEMADNYDYQESLSYSFQFLYWG